MSVFVERPNLPHNAEKILIGAKYSDILAKVLKNIGFSPIFVPDNPHVDNRLSGHCDLSVLHGGGDTLFLAPFLKNSLLSAQLSELGAKIIFPAISQGEKYPNDAQMNMAAVGKNLIYCEGVSSEDIVRYFTNSGGLTPCTGRQGYSRCSICIVDDNSIITADSTIAQAAKKSGLSVLQISPGNIDLKGFEYGFIGGAAFKLSDDKIAFTGSLDGHPDKHKIIDFLGQRDIRPVFLTDMPIFDIGGAVPITEKRL